MKRMEWKKGEVEELIYGHDSKVRGALLKVGQKGKVSYIKQPLQRIVPLEVQKECIMNCKNDVKEVNDNDNVNVVTSDLNNEANIINNINLKFSGVSNNYFMNTERNRHQSKRFEVKS